MLGGWWGTLNPTRNWQNENPVDWKTTRNIILGTPKTSPSAPVEVHRQSYKRRDLQTTQLDMERKCVFMTYLEGRSIIHVLVIYIMFVYIYIAYGQFLIMTCHELYLTSASKTSSQSSSPTSTVSRSLPTKITESSNHPIDSLQPRYGRSWIPPYQTRATRWMVGFTTLFHFLNTCQRSTHVHVAGWGVAKLKKAITGLSDIDLPNDASGSKPILKHLPRSKAFYRNTNSIKKHVMVDFLGQAFSVFFWRKTSSSTLS